MIRSYSKNKNNYSLITKYRYVDVFIVLFIYLSYYNIGPLNLSYFFGIICSFYTIYRTKKVIINKWLLYFFIYVIFNQIFLILSSKSYVSAELIIKNLIISLITVFIVSCLSDVTDENRLYKVYSMFGNIAMVGLGIHAYIVFILNRTVYPIILFSSFADNKMVTLINGINRPVSFFSEPQHYASFMLPLLFLTLKRKKFVYSILIFLTILMSTSSQGIVIGILLWCYFIIFKYNNKKMKILIIIVFVSTIALVLNMDMFQYSINKVLDINFQSDIRLSRGFNIFFEMDTLNKLFGIGPSSLTSYIILTGKSTGWLIESEQFGNFISTYSGVLVNYGAIACLIFNILLFKMYKMVSKENIGLFLIILISTFSQTILFNTWFVFYFIIFFNISDKNKKDFTYLRLKGVS